MFETPFHEISDARDKHAAAISHQIHQQTPPASAVAKVDLLALALSRFGEWRAGAAALVERYRAVAFDLSTPKGYAELTKAIAEVRAPRFAAQNVSKASKSELAGISKAIGAEEAAVTAYLADTEARLVKMRDEHDAKVAAAKAEAARIEAERIAGHQAKIATIKSFMERCKGLPAWRIELGIEQLQAQVYGEDMQEFRVPAVDAQCETLEAMRTLHAQTLAREEDEARIAAQRAENARLAAELAERQAALDRQAEEQRQLSLRLQAEEAQRQAAISAAIVRTNLLQARIAEIHAAATGHAGKTAWELSEAIVAVESLNVSAEQYQELAPLAAAAQASTLATLCGLHSAAVERELQAAEAAARLHDREAAAAIEYPKEQDSQQVLKAEPATADEAPAGGFVILIPPESTMYAEMSERAAVEPGVTLIRSELGQVDCGIKIVESLPEPTLTLGAINDRIAPLSITGAGLALLGFEPAGRRKSAVLFHESDWPAMRAAMVKQLTAA